VAAVAVVVGAFYFCKGPLADTSVPEEPPSVPEPIQAVPGETPSEPDPDKTSDSLFVHDSLELIRSFEPWMVFSENFHADYSDSAFSGSYQLVYPLGGPKEALKDSKFDRLLLSLLFGKNAPKKVDRKSIQTALDRMMKGDVNTTYEWWNGAKAKHGKRWREEVCGCSGYFYAMPNERSSHWISFQQISDYRCGGNGGPSEKYYTIVMAKDPYVVDTTAFVPGFRDKLVDMITDNVIYNFYQGELDRGFGRDEVREATAKQFAGNFQPVLTLSGVKFLFGTWALPGTCHADGNVSVIVSYNMIREIFTEKFRRDIGLY